MSTHNAIGEIFNILDVDKNGSLDKSEILLVLVFCRLEYKAG